MTDPTNLAEKYYADPVAWRADLLVRSSGQLVRFGDVVNKFQDDDFRAMDPAWERLLGKKVELVPFTRAMEIRPRGHSKTQDAAISAVRVVAFSRKRLVGIAASGDRDQAQFLLDAIARLIADNPYLGDVLEVQRNGVINTRTGSKLTVVTSDVATSWGHLIDFAILDELPTWPDAGEGLWHSLFSAADKQPNWTVLLVIGNAGFRESWQFKVVEDAQTHDDWYCNVLPGPVATWMDEKMLARQRRGLPEKVFNRVWLNQWASGSGDALSQEDIEACTNPSAREMAGNEPGYRWIAGLDLGISNDRSALCVIGIHPQQQRAKLAYCESWAPGPNRKVDLEEVKVGVLEAAWRFPGLVVAYDPWQAVLMATQLTREGVTMVELPFTGANCSTIASALLQAFSDRILELYPEPELLRGLGRLRIVEKSFGFKLEAPRDRTGHADLAMAFAMAVAILPQVVASYEEPSNDGLDEFFDGLLKYNHP